MRKTSLALLALAACVLSVVAVVPAAASRTRPAESDTHRLQRYAAGTWRSFTHMVDTPSGLPTDQLFADGHTDVQTSTTNIGAYLWSAVAAERLGHAQRTSGSSRG